MIQIKISFFPLYKFCFHLAKKQKKLSTLEFRSRQKWASTELWKYRLYILNVGLNLAVWNEIQNPHF